MNKREGSTKTFININKNKEQEIMRKATILILIAVLAFASVALAGKGDRDKNGTLTKKVITVDPNETYTSVNAGASGIKARTKGALIRKTATGASFIFPEASVYDYGTNSGNRTQVDVSDNGNVHLTAHIRTLTSSNDRHVIYWYNPGEISELDTDVSPAATGWPSIGVLADGRATITYHIDSASVQIDAVEGFGIFSSKGEPNGGGSVWMSHQVGSDDVMWFLTNRWDVNTWPGDTTRVWTSSDDGTSWTELPPVRMVGTHAGNPPEPVGRVSQDASEFLVQNEWIGVSEVTLDSATFTGYHWTVDAGANWNKVMISFDPYLNNHTDSLTVADVFMSGAGTEDTLIIENFGQVDITYDWEGNVHAIMNGYSWHWDAAMGETQFAWPQLHYSSVRGELAANLVEVSDPAISHSDILHAYTDSGYWAGNNIGGMGYPTISAIDDGPGLMAVWSQPRMVSGVVDTTGGFMNADLWAATSGDGGDKWTAPWQLTDTPGLHDAFATLGKPLETTGNADEYRFHLVYMEDHVPGTWVFGESDSGLVQWIYMTDLVTIVPVVGIEDENVISAKSFALEQNYPNPFNPSTTIEFTLDKKSDVKLTIFNMLGQEVTTLVNEVRDAGAHREIWDASNVASGVYFYKLSAGDLTRTKKMVLLK